MDWTHTKSEGCSVATSSRGDIVRQMYESLPNGDSWELLNPDGYYVCTGKSRAGLQLYLERELSTYDNY